jgi:hypothetical protein
MADEQQKAHQTLARGRATLIPIKDELRKCFHEMMACRFEFSVATTVRASVEHEALKRSKHSRTQRAANEPFVRFTNWSMTWPKDEHEKFARNRKPRD